MGEGEPKRSERGIFVNDDFEGMLFAEALILREGIKP
jgi:hypothetical protein